MDILAAIKKYKAHLALVGSMATMGSALFVKIDAYAQGKVDAGVEQLRNEVAREQSDVKADIKVMKAKQHEQQTQLDRMDSKQDYMIQLLLEESKKHK